jgi:hypothetical protein
MAEPEAAAPVETEAEVGGEVDPDRRAAVRSLVLLGAALVAVLVGVLVMATTADDRHEPSDLTLERGPDGEVAPVLEIGPRVGAEVEQYVAGRHEALEAAGGERLAVVSLDGYRAEDEARSLVGGAAVVALLVAAPGGEPRALEAPLGEWVVAEAEAARAEREEILSLLPTVEVTDPFRGFYEAEVERLAAMADALEAADAPLVFALVVRADAAALRSLTEVEGVRLVDVADGPVPAPSATYRGLRPEETTTAGTPDLRPS